MRRSSVLDLVRLHQSFETYGRHPRLVDYLAYPRIDLHGSNRAFVEKLLKIFENRTPFSEVEEGLGYAPQDATIVKKRIDLMASNNTAYAIAMRLNPSAKELERFSHIEPCWSLLFPVKLFLIHHVEQAREYRGMLPFGSEVIKFFNAAELGEINGSPTFANHTCLRDVTNDVAAHLGMTSVVLNNEMYLEGSRVKEKESE